MRHISSPASELVACFPCALAPRRREKGKTAARRASEAEGPVKEQVAGLPNGGGRVRDSWHTVPPRRERRVSGMLRSAASKLMLVGVIHAG